MNSMNYGPSHGQSKASFVERIFVAGAVLVVATGLIIGGGLLIQRTADQSQLSVNATTVAMTNSAEILYANPELKVLDYPQTDKAAVQVVTGWESRLLVFPEALDGMSAASVVNDFSINPELKALDYPVAVAAPEASLYDNPELKALNYAPVVAPQASLYENPELKVMDYPIAAATAISLYENPELKVLGYPDAQTIGGGIQDNPELRFLNYATPVEAAASAVDILRPYSNNR